MNQSRLRRVAWFMLGCAMVLQGCKPAHKASLHSGATGICYSRLATVKDGTVLSAFQFIIVQSSGNLSKDLIRLNDVDQPGWFFRSQDLTANVWHSAWLDDKSLDGTSGPDCSSLPMPKE